MTASHSGHLDTSIAPPHCIQIRDNKPRRSAIPFLHHSFHSFQDTRSKFEPLCVRAKLDHFLLKREMCLYPHKRFLPVEQTDWYSVWRDGIRCSTYERVASIGCKVQG